MEIESILAELEAEVKSLRAKFLKIESLINEIKIASILNGNSKNVESKIMPLNIESKITTKRNLK